mmetsp:Transcript_18556/g.34813  ORF Transcript_18556/g.34813 Transcript_18556/m.34813 type:complete len:108 (-) Transcript_18556:285-608(-)
MMCIPFRKKAIILDFRDQCSSARFLEFQFHAKPAVSGKDHFYPPRSYDGKGERLALLALERTSDEALEDFSIAVLTVNAQQLVPTLQGSLRALLIVSLDRPIVDGYD